MRRRSREISIFSLSMMDVVTGAMGAFLIVMVVLARYYESDPVNREHVDALKAELSQARDRLRDLDLAFKRLGAEGGDIADALAKAAGNLAAAERDADQLREQLDQAKQEIDRQDSAIQNLLKRRSFAVTSFWTCEGVDVDIYVWDTQSSAKSDRTTPLFDPDKTQWENYIDDRRVDWGTDGYESWLTSSSVKDTLHKVYIKLAEPAAVPAPCRVRTTIVHAGTGRSLVHRLSQAEPWAYIAKLKQNSDLENGYFELSEPSDAEIEAERRAVAARARGS